MPKSYLIIPSLRRFLHAEKCSMQQFIGILDDDFKILKYLQKRCMKNECWISQITALNHLVNSLTVPVFHHRHITTYISDFHHFMFHHTDEPNSRWVFAGKLHKISHSHCLRDILFFHHLFSLLKWRSFNLILKRCQLAIPIFEHYKMCDDFLSISLTIIWRHFHALSRIFMCKRHEHHVTQWPPVMLVAMIVNKSPYQNVTFHLTSEPVSMLLMMQGILVSHQLPIRTVPCQRRSCRGIRAL